MTQEQRIDELERQNRRFRRTGMAVLVTTLVALVVCVGLLATSRAGAQPGAPKPNYNTGPWRDMNPTPKGGIVTGGEFRLVDDSGATRAVLYMESGNPMLRFLGPKGERRAVIGLDQFGPLPFFARANGRPGTSIGVGGRGPSMAFGDTAGRPLIMVFLNDSTGMPKIVLRDTTGHNAWTAPEQNKH